LRHGTLNPPSSSVDPGLVLDERLPELVLHSDGTVTRSRRVLDVDTGGLPTDDVIAIPLPRPDARPAYFAVTAATHVARPRAEQRQVAALLAHLAAQSLTLKPSGEVGRHFSRERC
jgi:hypothetical protein